MIHRNTINGNIHLQTTYEPLLALAIVGLGALPHV